MQSLKYVGLDVHRDTISVAVLDEAGKLVMQTILATHADGDSGFCGRVKRFGSTHVGGRNTFGVAARFAGETGGARGGVRSAAERAAEGGQQERQD